MSKKKSLWSLLAIMMVTIMLSVGFVSCGDDDDDENGQESETINEQDPEGTIISNLTNTFYEYGWYWYDGIENMNGIERNYLGMNSSNNLEAESTNAGTVSIVSVGKVKSLSSINKIPENGWTNQVAAIPGYGYVYRSNYYGNIKYARIIAVKYMESTSGGIMGITIKYQENWENEDKN